MTFGPETLTGELPKESSFEAVLGVRPELVEIRIQPGEGTIPAQVYSVMPAGSETTVYLNVGAERLLSKQNGLKQYEPDQQVYLDIALEKINVFAKESGRLIKLAAAEEK